MSFWEDFGILQKKYKPEEIVAKLKDLEKENDRLRKAMPDLTPEKFLKEGCLGKFLSPACRRRRVAHVMAKFSVSERFACKVLGQHRSTQRKSHMAGLMKRR